MRKWPFNSRFAIVVFVLNFLLALYATPVIDHSDAPVYLAFSEALLGAETEVNYAHRSPFYAIVIAGIGLLIDSPYLHKAVVFFQYGLLAVTTLLLCRLFASILQGRWLPALGGLMFNLSLATIFFANIMMTEILTVFFLTLSVGLLFNAYERGRTQSYFWLGGVVGLLILTRFNTLPLLLTYVLLIGWVLYVQRQPLRQWAYSAVAFVLPLGFLLNAWCLYNLSHNNFYGLFPNVGQGVPRNITIASIEESDVVSAENEPVFRIFLKARQSYYDNLPEEHKGSLASHDRFNILPGLYGGYTIYLYALPDLEDHFELQPGEGEYELAQKLGSFYQEIADQNSGFIFKYRIVSFFSSFRAAVSGTLPDHYGNINLNALPAFLIVLYKISFLLMSVIAFLAFFGFAGQALWQRQQPNFYLLVCFAMVFSFWGINLVFVTGADANRYKFPADPFIIVLFLAYAGMAVGWLRRGRKADAPPAAAGQKYRRVPAQ